MEDQQLPNFLVKRAFLTPNRPALQFNNQEYSFHDLYERAYQIAGQITAKNVQKDDYVAVMLSNHEDTIFIYLALQLIGVKTVILNYRLSVDEIIWQMKDSRSTLLITEEKYDESFKKINQIDNSLPIIKKEELFCHEWIEPIINELVQSNDVCSIMYTSGTTGYPKGVLQTYGNHWWSAIGSALNLGLTEKDCWLCAVPLFHISGYSILMKSLIYGMKIILHESFSEVEAIKEIQSENVTIMSVVSTMASRMVEKLGDEKFPPTFRCWLLGGGPAHLSLLEKCVEKNIPVFQTYGMTETSSQIVTLSPEDSIKKLGSAGKPFFASQIKIVDSNGTPVKANEAGEIHVKGPNVTIGYLNKPTETSDKIKEGWLATGDIGYQDDEGFLYVLDRRSDLIISGGENIYPAEIEGVLTSHPNVQDAGVIGIEDVEWGQKPIAFVRPKEKITEEDLIHYVRERLAKFKVPKRIYFVEEIPRNAAKKLLRRKLKEMLEKGALHED
ncbi:o-succinylbenzoate--CoA ligase [Bacillus massilinigeriensis]|uniref:o-succinylbenzoate--CoA ligase n=1 Tax=Bacillus massilionigeriensis TaxID=1805475 RepID=UPI00096B522A|nr:o-succinylbenzoate--CoA ligase [Bacillus massilionigeriensis]